jgi:hypothetical protein
MFGRRAAAKSADDRQQVMRCSFCNKSQDDVRKLIAGPSVFICDECVLVCNEILSDEAFSSRSEIEGGGELPADAESTQRVLVVPCALCGLPTSLDEALVIRNRGALCGGCVGEIKASLADTRDGAS